MTLLEFTKQQYADRGEPENFVNFIHHAWVITNILNLFKVSKSQFDMMYVSFISGEYEETILGEKVDRDEHVVNKMIAENFFKEQNFKKRSNVAYMTMYYAMTDYVKLTYSVEDFVRDHPESEEEYESIINKYIIQTAEYEENPEGWLMLVKASLKY